MTEETKGTFLRQSGWLALATAIGGATSYAVHFFAKDLPKDEYGVFTTLLQILNMVAIPAIGLQTVFAQQAAAAKSDADEKQLTVAALTILRVLIGLWLVAAFAVLIGQQQIADAIKINDPRALWLTIISGLFALGLPMAYGLLQGRQNFLWYGWAAMMLGGVRLVAVAALLMAVAKIATNAMVGVLLGYIVAFAIAWRARGLRPADPDVPFEWRDWLRRVVPISIGAGAFIFMMSADMVIVQRHFDEKQTGLYAAAGMIGRALVFLISPLVAVMFPKIVRSHTTGKDSGTLRLTLLLTGMLGVIAGLGATCFPALPLNIVYDETFHKVAPLVPWFVWAMVPLTLGAVLSNNLIARGRYEIAYALAIVCAGYAITLWLCAPGLAEKTPAGSFQVQSYIGVAKILGMANLIFLAVAGFFTWRMNGDVEGAH